YVKKLSKLYKNTVPIIQPEELQEAMDAEEELVLLDTRQPREYEVSHLPGAKFVNFNKFNKKDFAKMDRSAKVIVYCSVGYRSERIGEKLKKMGFENVQNLYGGIFEWKNQGHGVVNESGSETERVHCYNKDWGRWLKDGEKVYK
ncbi:MAG TPA: rhodanese-like domain-containing protein, partial [Bacteroidetes bacterium]|nr:rhodanese-like domain-containing protein [Bacteroidota bacterium]